MTATVMRGLFATGASAALLTPAERKGKPTISVDLIDSFTLIFEGYTCSRCGGDGRWKGYTLSGCCFACNGNGARYTPRGAAALARFRSLCEQLTVPVEDLQPGDRVWDEFRGLSAWVTIEAIVSDHTPGSFTVGAGGEKFTTPYTASVQVTIAHPAGRYTNCTYAGLAERAAMMPRWDAERATVIVNEVAALPGATLRAA